MDDTRRGVGTAEPAGSGWPARAWARVPWALRIAVLPWALSRAVVLGSLVLAQELADRAHPSSAVVTRVHEGLLGWDAGWYEAIARHGYGGVGHESLRFFPLLPLLVRLVSFVPGIGAGAALLVVTNAAALGATSLVAGLTRRESGDEATARRAAWLLCLAPPAFTLVMGYAEATFVLLAAGVFVALRRGRWWWAAALGLAAGLARPLGPLLALPAALEGLRGWRQARGRERLGRIGAVAGPVLGAGAYLGWVAWRYGDGFAPLRVQTDPTHRGGFVDPVVTLGRDLRFLVQGHHVGEGLHLPWVVLAVMLTVVCFRRFPASYGLFAAAVVAVSLSASNLDGFERYALSAFPLVMALAGVLRDGRAERAVYVLAGAGLVGYSLLAFTNLYTP